MFMQSMGAQLRRCDGGPVLSASNHLHEELQAAHHAELAQSLGAAGAISAPRPPSGPARPRLRGGRRRLLRPPPSQTAASCAPR